MAEKGIRGGICHAVFQHAKANNKYMKESQNKTMKSQPFLMYLCKNNLYGKAMSPRLPVNCFEWDKISKIPQNFVKK